VPQLIQRDPSETVVLAGAGISVEEPSGIPAAWGLSEALLRWITSSRSRRSELARRMTPGNQFNPYQFLRFEGLIQAIAAIDPNVFRFLEATQAYGAPNPNHRMLARMALEGATILTTNFDTRIEQAAGEAKLSTFVLSASRRAPTTSDRLIKLHGSFPWKRGRNVTPHATLTQIGKLGLGFERFPEFRDWFRSTTAGKQLIVIGYSASDSFDVVPLIENEVRAKSVMWLSYEPDPRRLAVKRIRAGTNDTPFPPRRTVDFVANTLDSLARRHSPLCNVYRVHGASIVKLLNQTVRLSTIDWALEPNLRPASQRNLKLVQTTLAENPLSALQKRVILRTINDGVFGESYATDVEAKPIRRGKQVFFEQSKVRFRRGTVEYRADTAFRKGQPDMALGIMEGSARKTPDADQLLLLLHHFEFRLGEQESDLHRLDRAIRKTEVVSKRSGLLWGLIMAKWMKSFRLEAGAKRPGRTFEVAAAQARAILSSSHETIYYGVRAGWQSWYAPTARLAAKHAAALKDFDTAAGLLIQLLFWLDRESADGIQESAGTACALNTLGIRSQRAGLIKTAQQTLKSLDERTCPVVKLLRVAAAAEIAHAKSNWRELNRLERSANHLILKLDPADHWNVRGVFEYLRQSRVSQKQSK